MAGFSSTAAGKSLRGLATLEDGIVTVGEQGTAQGSGISPLLSNVYLHYVFDVGAQGWRRREARPRFG